MDIGEKVGVRSKEVWRSWLLDHHRDKHEIWVVCYKKGSGYPSVSYEGLVEEAVCFGWVDGMKSSIGEISYGLRFTPRKKKSNWSDSNIARLTKLIGEDKVMPDGLAVVPEDVMELVLKGSVKKGEGE